MNSRSALFTICRGCGRRTVLPSSSSPFQSPLSARTKTPHPPHFRTRLLTTATKQQAQIADRIPQEAAEAPPSPPTPQSNEQPDETTKIFTATITSIHNLTARATYTKQYWDAKFQKHYTKKQHVLVHSPPAAALLNSSQAAQLYKAPKPKSPSSSTTPSDSSKPVKQRTPAEIAKVHHRPSLLRVGDVVNITPFTAQQLLIRAERKEFFSQLELQRKLKDAGKHKKQVINEHEARKGKTTRTNRGIRYVVKEVVTPFGDSVEERVRKLEGGVGAVAGAGLGGIDPSNRIDGDRMAWWKRREQRGELAK
jgi:hypothetical protein